MAPAEQSGGRVAGRPLRCRRTYSRSMAALVEEGEDGRWRPTTVVQQRRRRAGRRCGSDGRGLTLDLNG